MRNLYNIDDWLDAPKCRLGEILIESGRINLYHLSMVLDIQKFQDMPMGEIFLAMKVVSKEDLAQALKIQKIIKSRSNAEAD